MEDALRRGTPREFDCLDAPVLVEENSAVQSRNDFSIRRVAMVNRANKPLAFLLTLFFLAAVWIAAFNCRYEPLWTIGDWLINYSAGFVRRGLPGEVFLLLSRLLHVSVSRIALVIPALIYGIFLIGVYRLANPLKRNLLWWAMLFSPATIPFIVLNANDIAFRKETLLLAALALFIYLLQRDTRDVTLGCALTIMLVTLTLSHEATIVCFPYFVAAIALVTGSSRRAACLAWSAGIREHPHKRGRYASPCMATGRRFHAANYIQEWTARTDFVQARSPGSQSQSASTSSSVRKPGSFRYTLRGYPSPSCPSVSR
jgi:hypothetical protein